MTEEKPIVNATPAMSGKLKVTVISCEGLRAADSILQGGKSDPFCVLRIRKRGLKKGKESGKSVKTTIKPNTLNPEWNESFEFDLEDGHFQSLYVNIYDHNKIALSNDYLGRCECYLGHITHGTVCVVDLDVQYGKGSIKLALEGLDFGYFADDMIYCVQKTRSFQPPKLFGKLEVTLVSAKGLPNVDVIGACDPFVIAIMRRRRKMKKKKGMKKKQKFKTKVKKGKNPTWNQTFTFDVVHSEEQFVELQILDWDRITSNDPLGLVIVPLSSLKREKLMEFSFPIELGKGTLQVSVHAVNFGIFETDEHQLFKETMEKSVLVGKEVALKKGQSEGGWKKLITGGAGFAKAASVVVPM